MFKELVDKRNELEAKRAALDKVFEEAGPDIDLSRVESLKDLEPTARVEKIREWNAEINDLAEQVEKLAEVENAKLTTERLRQIRHPEPETKEEPTGPKGPGTLFVESKAYKAWQDGGRTQVSDVLDVGLKALFQTGAGWAPESTRIGFVAEAAVRPIQVTDIIPMGQTGQASIVYMEETTRTHAAAETAEAGVYPESTFALTEQTSNVRKIADSIPVTDEQLDDVQQVESYLNSRLEFGVRQRLDGQIIAGDGIAPNLTGILNTTGIQTQAKGSDPTPDAIHKAMTLVRLTGRANPTHVLLHPNDWQEIRLLRTADGIYIWGSPSEAGPGRIWGLPVVETDTLTEGTGLVGSFIGAWIMLFERKGIEVQVGFVNDDFTRGQKRIRADMRVALVLFRPAAFATVTGI